MKQFLFTLLFATLTLSAGAQNKFAGIWEGVLNAGGKAITLVFHINEENGKLSAKMDSPDQGVVGTPASDVIVTGDSVTVVIAAAGIKYGGRLYEGRTLLGNFMQAGYTFPMNLNRTETPTQLVRPQTPIPPFSYKSENVTYTNADKSIKYGATLTIPEGTGPFPAILLLTGSGPQNRDEEIFGHKPFAVLADYLTKKGYVVLRVDDRGVGQTTGDAQNATTADFVKDAATSFAYLLSRKEADRKRSGLLGHSEGALIAMMLAAENKDVNFIVSMAGPGIRINMLMEEQTAAVMRGNGADSVFVHDYRRLYRKIIDAINASKDSVEVVANIKTGIANWKQTVNQKTIADMGLADAASEEQYIQAYVDIFNNKWYNYFLRMNPQEYLTKLSCKVLALNGEKDIQVASGANLAGFQDALAKSKSPAYEVKELKGLNHLFQECNTCIVGEYALLPETISPTALTAISTWLNKNIR